MTTLSPSRPEPDSLPEPTPPQAAEQAYADELLAMQQRIDPSDRILPGLRMDAVEYRRRGEVLARRGIEFRSELIHGEVVVTAPPDLEAHAEPGGDVHGLLWTYARKTPGVKSALDGGIDVEGERTVAPDCLLRIVPECGGQMRRDRTGRLAGVPELCVEIAHTSILRDATTKRDLYEAAGVQEYLIHAVSDRRFVAFHRQGDRFTTANLAGGVFRSTTFPGLHIDCDALGNGDIDKALTTLEAGLATPEHAAFVAELASRRSATETREDQP